MWEEKGKNAFIRASPGTRGRKERNILLFAREKDRAGCSNLLHPRGGGEKEGAFPLSKEEGKKEDHALRVRGSEYRHKGRAIEDTVALSCFLLEANF